MARSQVFRPGELPLVLLALLRDQPRNGHALMGELERVAAPYYRPSPGSVYPALAALESEGLISAELASGVRTFELTEVGRDALTRRVTVLAGIEQRLGLHLTEESKLARVLADFQGRVLAVAGRVDAEAVAGELDRTASRIEKWSR